MDNPLVANKNEGKARRRLWGTPIGQALLSGGADLLLTVAREVSSLLRGGGRGDCKMGSGGWSI